MKKNRASNDAGARRNRSAAITVRRVGPVLTPDPSRVLLKPFKSGNRRNILRKVTEYVLSLTADDVDRKLALVIQDFGSRHPDLESYFQRQFDRVNKSPGSEKTITKARRTLIGSYFCHEYSVEAAALFNPSIVRHPDQSGLGPGALRFVLSLRATGEGHISSLTFRTGVIDEANRISVLPPKKPLVGAESYHPSRIDKGMFVRQLDASGLLNDRSREVMASLPDPFDCRELLKKMKKIFLRTGNGPDIGKSLVGKIKQLAQSDFEVAFDPQTSLSQRVLFPFTTQQRNGIEDARFVDFHNENGERTFYATYTAYDGKHIRPGLLSTVDFEQFRFIGLAGDGIENKGMSLFPRKIAGRYYMLSRQDDRNILLMSSDDVQFWTTPRILIEPVGAWEMLKIGSCSSPIETEAGWLVLSHGVGPMRRYGIGAFLLDLDDPSRILGRVTEPFMLPDASEREGYVPNVLYTCGALLHRGTLVIPYAMSDSSTSFAVVGLNDVLNSLTIKPIS